MLFLRGKIGSPSTIVFSSLSILGSLGVKPKNYLGAFTWISLTLTILFASIALARPQWRTEFTDKKASGVDIMIAVDISLSMTAVEKVYGNRSRMDAARDTIKDFILSRPNDRIGITSFAGRDYLEAAITLDHPFVLEKLEELNPDRSLNNGTAIGSAISSSTLRLLERKDTKSRVIILITDGSSNTGKLSPIQAAEATEAIGIKIHTVAIGTKEGRVSEKIQRYPYQEFDTATLQKIAKLTKGQYYRPVSTSGLNDALDSINKLEKTDRSQKVISRHTEYHFWFTAAALAMALCNIILVSIAPAPAPEQ